MDAARTWAGSDHAKGADMHHATPVHGTAAPSASPRAQPGPERPALPVDDGARLVRGAAGAVLAVGLAAASHTVLGAGHVPHPLVLVLAVALAAPICTLLAGRRLCLPRVVAAVLGSQALLHGLCALPAPAPGALSSLPAAAGHSGHLGHAVPAGLTTPPAATAAADQHGVAMLAAHAAAALLTVLLIRHGERLLTRAAGVVVDAVLRHRVPALRPPAGRLRLVWAGAGPAPRAGRDLAGAAGLRGPPVALQPA